MMAGIKGKNTKPELLIRKALFAKGFRYRLHSKLLAGKPDIVLSKYKAVIFIHGCFWHGHACHLFRLPKSNSSFWAEKINKNKCNDALVLEQLANAGWRIAIIWECALKGKTKLDFGAVIDALERWILSDKTNLSLGGVVTKS